MRDVANNDAADFAPAGVSVRKRTAAPAFGSRTMAIGIGRAMLATVSAVVVIVALMKIAGDSVVGSDWAVPIAVASSVWLVIYFLSSFLISGSVYLLTSTYVIAFSLFHLGITLPDGFKIFPDITWGVTRLAPWLSLAGWYTVLALGCIGIGFLFGCRKNLLEDVSKDTFAAVSQETKRTAAWAGIGLLCAAVLFFVLAIASYGNIFAYERTELFRGAGDSRGWGAFMMTLPSAAILLCLGAQTRTGKIYAVMFAFFAAAFFLLIGYRSAALFPTLIGIVLWIKAGNRVPLVIAVIVFAGTVLAIPAAGLWRSFNAYSEIDQETVVSSFEKTQARQTLEQGRTAGVLAHILKLTPHEDPYRWGMTYLKTLPEAIPNILPKIGESKRKRVQDSILKDEALLDLPPGSWLTYRIAPQKFRRGEGVGFTSVGEAYINFGTAGVVCFFLLVGVLLGRLDSMNLLLHPFLLVFCGAALWPFLRTVRNDFSNFVKPLGFLFIILVIWEIITRVFPIVGRRNPPAPKRLSISP